MRPYKTLDIKSSRLAGFGEFKPWRSTSTDNGEAFVHKVELDGSPQVSSLFIGEDEVWKVEYIPYEFGTGTKGNTKAPGTRIEGRAGIDQLYVGENSPPTFAFGNIYAVARQGECISGQVEVSWSFADAHSDACTVDLSWTDGGPEGLREIATELEAGQLRHAGLVALDGETPIRIHAVIRDIKGAVTQVTSGEIIPLVSGKVFLGAKQGPSSGRGVQGSCRSFLGSTGPSTFALPSLTAIARSSETRLIRRATASGLMSVE